MSMLDQEKIENCSITVKNGEVESYKLNSSNHCPDLQKISIPDETQDGNYWADLMIKYESFHDQKARVAFYSFENLKPKK